MKLKKLLHHIYTFYLNIFFSSIEIKKSSSVDCRCEIDKKSNICIGRRSILYKHCTLYKNTKAKFNLGDNSHIAPYGYFLLEDQNISIGNNVAIAKNCSFFCSTNSIPSDSNILYKDSYAKGDIEVGDNVFMGANCVVLPGTIIEDNVVIAANSTVKGNLENGYLYGGNPVQKIKKVFE